MFYVFQFLSYDHWLLSNNMAHCRTHRVIHVRPTPGYIDNNAKIRNSSPPVHITCSIILHDYLLISQPLQRTSKTDRTDSTCIHLADFEASTPEFAKSNCFQIMNTIWLVILHFPSTLSFCAPSQYQEQQNNISNVLNFLK